MTDLRNTIAHILEHKQHLAKVNEATTQQYVVLPILRALGWDDANLASMEVLPEYAVENGHVDYALKIGQTPKLFIECKKWDEPLKKHESQIANYAFNAGVPIGVLTNGKIWYFYFSWVEGKPVAERIFCEIDIGNIENA
ncbi:restriction endonuclease subunit R, partial [Candidatus Poribacteria bacterium]|nr:restriction endonuclease subunit R [Candidatus Poribacteria bacterium]